MRIRSMGRNILTAPMIHQEIGRISQSQKELSEEVTLAKAQLKNRQQVRYYGARKSCSCCTAGIILIIMHCASYVLPPLHLHGPLPAM